MKKTAVVVIALMILSTSYPSYIFAESNEANLTSIQTKESTLNKEEGITQQQSKTRDVIVADQESSKSEENEAKQGDQQQETVDKDKTNDLESETSEDEIKDTEVSKDLENDESNDANENPSDKEVSTEQNKTPIKEEGTIPKSSESDKKSVPDKSSNNRIRTLLTVETTYKESATSKLGRILTGDARIYKTIGDKPSSIAGKKYTNQTFYIKKQAEGNGQVYYLISTERSSINGVIGWVKAADMHIQQHISIDNKGKTRYLDGTGWAYTTPWGDTKDITYRDLSTYKNHVFQVNLTEKVGNYIWYRGEINGKLVWIQGYNVIKNKTYEESATSKLGRIQSSNAIIYERIGVSSSGLEAGTKHTNQTYYIKKQADENGQLYYLISTQPSSTQGVIGWVKEEDIRVQQHVQLNDSSKRYYLDGTGWAYTTPWGDSQDIVYKNLSIYKNQTFNVNLTVKVGNYLWYRGHLNGKLVWIQGYNIMSKTSYEESTISKLGRVQSSNAYIYKDIYDSTSNIQAGSKYTNKTYYIKKQARVNGDVYYLISTKPSSTQGVIGWVKADDTRIQQNVRIDAKEKTYYLDGTGWAYITPWGDNKDVIYKDLSLYKNQAFKIDLTEKVGNYFWYRGQLKGESVWIQGYNVMEKTTYQENTTSKIGRIQDSNTPIYQDIYDSTSIIQAGTKYVNKIVYIKKQAKVNGDVYYLISNQRSSTDGVIGWVKENDIRVQDHIKIGSEQKVYYLDGTGAAYSDPWGGSQNILYKDLISYKGQIFKINLTEKIGDYIWYRGTLNGKSVWIQSYNFISPKEITTSKLGRIDSTNVGIYKTIGDSQTSIQAGSKYTNKVFYIKKQAELYEQKYYLISTQPSSTSGVIGWVKVENIRAQKHVTIDNKEKRYLLDGTGWAYTDPWGGAQDVIYKDLSEYKSYLFKINLTEKVGDYIWYRGELDNRSVWIQGFNVKTIIEDNTFYDMSLTEMVDIQISATPQTDKQYKLWIRGDAIENIEGDIATIDQNVWNLRRGPGTFYSKDGQVQPHSKHRIITSSMGTDDYRWYSIDYTYGWVTPDDDDLRYYLTPLNFTDSFRGSLQFLDLSQSAGINSSEVNEKILKGKGILDGKAQSFIEAGEEHGVNEIYLISHALLETGNGTSALATGVKVDGLQGIKTVYNMYGVGAYDSCAIECGAQYAYDHGWFTPELAIKGGAAFIGNGYVNNGQNTLYKMRWDPVFAARYGRFGHQYATDIGWAYKQTYSIDNIYGLLDSFTLLKDIPVYK